MIKVRGLKHHLIDIPYMDVGKGRVAVIGRNGAGKTTFLELLAGIERPHHGEVTLFGAAPKQSKVGWVGEFPDRTMLFSQVFDEVASSLRFNHVPSAEVRDRVVATMAMLGKGELIARSTRSLSGGEKATVAVAAAVANSPDLLILDEVDSHLDEGTASLLWAAISKTGLPTVYCTQDMDRASEADHVIVFDEGMVKASGSPAEVFSALEGTCFYPSLWRLES